MVYVIAFLLLALLGVAVLLVKDLGALRVRVVNPNDTVAPAGAHQAVSSPKEGVRFLEVAILSQLLRNFLDFLANFPGTAQTRFLHHFGAMDARLCGAKQICALLYARRVLVALVFVY